MNSRPEHLLAPGDIPVVQIDRGGQVTYHGPGQLVVYPLLDLSRHGLGVRALVEGIERAIVATVAQVGHRSAGAPRCTRRVRRRTQIGEHRVTHPPRALVPRPWR
jgi:lipoyl(octanoyl) transferase